MAGVRGGHERPIRERVIRLALAVALGLAMTAGATWSAVALPATQAQSGQTAVISGGGDGVNLRAEASFGAEVLAVVPDGVQVTLRIDMVDTVLDPDGQTRWWPVSVDGVDGWVTGYYLSESAVVERTEGQAPESQAADPVPESGTTGEPGDGEDAADPADFATTTADPNAATARVADPEGLNVRAEPAGDAEIVTLAAAGRTVTLRTAEVDIVYDAQGRAWWPIEVDGQAGWVVGAYLTNGADETAGEPVSTETTDAAVAFAAGQYVVAVADGDGVNIRVEATVSADRVGFVTDGQVVQVMDGPASFEASTAGWYLVTDGDVTGYVDGDLFAPADQLPAPADAETDPAPATDPVRFAVGQIALVSTGDGEDLNVRTEPTVDSEVRGQLTDLVDVEILDGPYFDDAGAAWYWVSDGSTQGFASGRYLVASDLESLPAAAEPTDSPPPTPVPAEPEPTVEAPAPAPTATVVPTQAPPPPPPGVGSGTFIYPTQGQISQNYGCSPFPFYPYDANLGCPFHNGLDIAAPSYTPIIASDTGTVTYAGWCDCGLGFYVEIDHGNGYATVYGHMAEMPYVATGQVVTQGELIGPLGSTGLSTGPHIHFMVKIDGVTIDPLNVLQ